MDCTHCFREISRDATGILVDDTGNTLCADSENTHQTDEI